MISYGAGAVGAVLLAAAACGDPLGPPFSERVSLVRVGGPVDRELDTHRVLAIGLDSRQALGWSESIMYRVNGSALSPDGELLYVTGTGHAGWKDSQIAALDTRTLRIDRREFFADSAGWRRDQFGGLGINGSHEVQVSPDGSRIFIGHASTEDDGGWGVAVLAAETFEAAGVIGPFPKRNMSLAMVPPGSFNRNGAVALTTEPATGWPNVSPKVWFVDPVTLVVLDSADVSAALGPDDGIAEIAAAPDGRSVYLYSLGGWLLKYDLIAGGVVARVSAPRSRWLTVAPDGERIYVVWGYTIDAPPPGIISVYDANLEELPPIDLSSIELPTLNQGAPRPPALNGMAVDDDGILILASGAVGPQLWGGQAGRIFFLDVGTPEVLDVVRISGAIAAAEILLP